MLNWNSPIIFFINDFHNHCFWITGKSAVSNIQTSERSLLLIHLVIITYIHSLEAYCVLIGIWSYSDDFYFYNNNSYSIQIIKEYTVRPRFWQLIGAAKMCGQNRVLPESDSEWKIDNNSRSNIWINWYELIDILIFN